MCQAYGVLGYPLGHSLSPYLHNSAFELHNMQRCYFKWEIRQDDLEAFMRSVRILPLSGISVTIPYKENIIKFLDEITPEAQAMGAVNTVYQNNGILVGANTDFIGFMEPIKHLPLQSALVCGAGGAARSVIYGLKKLGLESICLCNRSTGKAAELAQEFKVDHILWEDRHKYEADLLVNTTPLGTSNQDQDLSPWEIKKLPFKVVYDLVYNPLETVLLKQAASNGAVAVSGLSMFVHQAAEQFRIWTNEKMNTEWAEKLLREKLGS